MVLPNQVLVRSGCTQAQTLTEERISGTAWVVAGNDPQAVARIRGR